jgi:hypothetical protein
VELRAFLRILWRRWWLVVAPVLVVLAHLLVTYQSPPTFYQVVMRFAAGTVPAGLSVDYDRYYSWLTSEYIANGLADVARTRAFAEAVAARLAGGGLSADPAAIQGAIVTDNAQSILVVYLTWPDPAQAVAVAQAIAAELTENGPSYFPQIPWPQEAGPAARLLDEPDAGAAPPVPAGATAGPGDSAGAGAGGRGGAGPSLALPGPDGPGGGGTGGTGAAGAGPHPPRRQIHRRDAESAEG